MVVTVTFPYRKTLGAEWVFSTSHLTRTEYLTLGEREWSEKGNDCVGLW